MLRVHRVVCVRDATIPDLLCSISGLILGGSVLGCDHQVGTSFVMYQSWYLEWPQSSYWQMRQTQISRHFFLSPVSFSISASQVPGRVSRTHGHGVGSGKRTALATRACKTFTCHVPHKSCTKEMSCRDCTATRSTDERFVSPQHSPLCLSLHTGHRPRLLPHRITCECKTG